MAKIYVGNLPFTADEASVRTLFAQHGEVTSVSLPVDRDTGRPRGFGFIEMSSAVALCVIAPTLIKSTPASAYSRMF